MSYSKAEALFEKYVEPFDTTIDDKMKLRYEHTYKTVTMSEALATNIGLDEEGIEISKIIALFHDIGRFLQIKDFDHYSDHKSFDHADYSDFILTENNFLEKCFLEQKWWPIIQKAVKNHNKYKIEENLTQEELLYARVIRDVDKLDILNTSIMNNLESLVKKPDGPLSPEAFNDFMNCTSVTNRYVRTKLDSALSKLAFIFDINFIWSLNYMIENKYIDAIIDKMSNSAEIDPEQMNQIKECVNSYIKRRIGNGDFHIAGTTLKTKG